MQDFLCNDPEMVRPPLASLIISAKNLIASDRTRETRVKAIQRIEATSVHPRIPEVPGNPVARGMSAAGADAYEEGAQRTGRLGGCPGRFDQHGAGVAARHLADATVLRKAKARLANPRIEAKIADELLRRGKTPSSCCRKCRACRCR